MAAGDIHISVVPSLSTVNPYTVNNAYGGTETLTTKSIGNDPALIELYINQVQAASPAKTLLQVLDGGNRLTLILKES
jgi:hypothetical protein